MKSAPLIHFCCVLLFGLTSVWAGNDAAPAMSAPTTEPQLFEGLGDYTRPIQTAHPDVQTWFDQGMAWLHAFNFAEATRSFTRATELDPECAMAWWGIAYANSPNYNNPVMTEARNEAAWSAIQNALAHSGQASETNRELIHALAQRFANPAPEDRSSLDQAYAKAMAALWAEHPNDPDIGAFYADAMMVQRPWKLYNSAREPEGDTHLIVETLERVMSMAPQHPGANHLYIHAVEPSATPAMGLGAAERLKGLMPGAGHMLHMPSHIYVQTNMWEESIRQNTLAIAADDHYRALSQQQGPIYMYMMHNAHMLAFSAMMVGRENEAMAAARKMWEILPADHLEPLAPFLDTWMCSVYDVQKRFGRWDALLAEPAPPEQLPVTTAIWRAHRAIAYAARKQFDLAEREYVAFRRAAAQVPEKTPFGDDHPYRTLKVSDFFVLGEIALQKEDWENAVSFLEKAIAQEDQLGYGEPPQYLQPTRHTLGAVYQTMGRHADAERVFREDLDIWPGNGWALYGLYRALQAQGKDSEAARVLADFNTAWSKADMPIATSCMCIRKI